jgi:hypothetical protein
MMLVPWLRRHPLLGYFLIVYGISWTGILVVLSFSAFNLTTLRPLDTGLIFIAMLLGPSSAGLTSTAVIDGRMRDLAIRCNAAPLVVAVLAEHKLARTRRAGVLRMGRRAHLRSVCPGSNLY